MDFGKLMEQEIENEILAEMRGDDAFARARREGIVRVSDDCVLVSNEFMEDVFLDMLDEETQDKLGYKVISERTLPHREAIALIQKAETRQKLLRKAFN